MPREKTSLSTQNPFFVWIILLRVFGVQHLHTWHLANIFLSLEQLTYNAGVHYQTDVCEPKQQKKHRFSESSLFGVDLVWKYLFITG